MDSSWWGVKLFIGFVVAGIILTVLSYEIPKRRRIGKLRLLAGQLGLSFAESDDKAEDQILSLFSRVKHEPRRTVSAAENVMRGRLAGGDILLCDFHWWESRRQKPSSRFVTTVALWRAEDGRLPDFVLVPRRLGTLITGWDSARLVSFEQSKAFSEEYYLAATDETAVRAVFRAEVLSHFERQPGWTVEVHGSDVLVCRTYEKAEPEAIPDLLERSYAINRLLWATPGAARPLAPRPLDPNAPILAEPPAAGSGRSPVLRRVIIGAVLVLIGLIVWRIRPDLLYMERKRTGQMEAAARELGFVFTHQIDAAAAALMARSALAEAGGDARVRNVLAGRVEGDEVLIFDYSLSAAGRKREVRSITTVALWRSPGREFPAFRLESRSGLLDEDEPGDRRVQEIEFPESSEFSKEYRLTGPDAVSVRRLFGPELLSHFANHPAWSVESFGRGVLLHGGAGVEAYWPTDFYQDTRRMYRELSSHQPGH